MNREYRRRHGMTPNHERVLRALMEATEGVKGDTYHEAQLAHDLGMNVEDVRRYRHELTFWGDPRQLEISYEAERSEREILQRIASEATA